jgi:hypothetical protein
MTLTSIGDRVETGTYRFHSRFARAVNFERKGCLVSVVDEEVGAGPQNIVLRGLKAGLKAGSRLPLEIGIRAVAFEGRRFSFAGRHRYESKLSVGTVDLAWFHHSLRWFGEFLRKSAPPKSLAFLLDDKRTGDFRPGFERAFQAQVRCAVHEIFQGNLLDGVRGLKGCGLGLTPSGDDFIAGLVIGLRLLQQMQGRDYQAVADTVANAARGTNIFSNTFLELARQGLLFGRMKDLILAMVNTDQGATVRRSRSRLKTAAARLLAIGGCSGADLGTGFFMTVSAWQSSRASGIVGRVVLAKH